MAIGQHVAKYQAEKAAKDAQTAHEDQMAIADPKEYAVIPKREEPEPAPSVPTMADMLALIKQLAVELRSTPAPDTISAAQKQVELMERLLIKTRPENPEHPGISVYSYPEGDLARPKPALKCKMTWVGYELNTDTLTPHEIDLLNRLEAGDTRVTKADGTPVPFKVHAKYSDKVDLTTGRYVLEQLDVWFPCKGEHRQNHMSMTSYLNQALGEHIPTIEEAMVELARLRRELEAAKAGVVGVV